MFHHMARLGIEVLVRQHDIGINDASQLWRSACHSTVLQHDAGARLLDVSARPDLNADAMLLLTMLPYPHTSRVVCQSNRDQRGIAAQIEQLPALFLNHCSCRWTDIPQNKPVELHLCAHLIPHPLFLCCVTTAPRSRWSPPRTAPAHAAGRASLHDLPTAPRRCGVTRLADRAGQRLPRTGSSGTTARPGESPGAIAHRPR